MKNLTILFILLFSFTAATAQENLERTNDEPCLKLEQFENVSIINTNAMTNTIVFEKKKATFYLEDFGLEKISRAKHTQFFYKKPTKKIC